MALTLELFEKILADDNYLIKNQDITIYPTPEQISSYRITHPNYNGPYIDVWSLYYSIICHLADKPNSIIGKEEHDVMNDSFDAGKWKQNENHNVKLISAMYISLKRKMEMRMKNNNNEALCEWKTLVDYTSKYLQCQISNVLSDKDKARQFFYYDIHNLTPDEKTNMHSLLKLQFS
jgi:hypothetical protein